MINNRFSKANNPYVPNKDPKQATSYVMYVDANNPYGWGMSQPLSTGEFAWSTGQEMSMLDLKGVPHDIEQGYILKVDLGHPSELHDLHNDYFAPERTKILPLMLSPYCQELSNDLPFTPNASHSTIFFLLCFFVNIKKRNINSKKKKYIIGSKVSKQERKV